MLNVETKYHNMTSNEIPTYSRTHGYPELRVLHCVRRLHSMKRDATKNDRFIAIPEMRMINMLPRGLRYDGVMSLTTGLYLQFTETDKTVASHGATFYLAAEGFTLEKLAQRRGEKRVEFEAGAKLAA